MNKLKKIIIMMLVIIILIVVIIISMIEITRKKNIEKEDSIELAQQEYTEQIQAGTIDVTSSMEYYNVNSCINTYLQIINTNNSSYYGYNQNNEYIKLISDDDINKMIYDLLSTDYIEKNIITINNIRNKVTTIDEQEAFIPLDMKVKYGDKSNKYLVHGILINDNNQYKDEIYVFVNIDSTNVTYSIEPIYKNKQNIIIENQDQLIESNGQNQYTNVNVNDETIIKDYLNKYKKLALIKPEIMYEYLDETYREKKFGSVDKFKEYINDNKDLIATRRMKKYQVNKYDNYTECICIDQDDNYYIFNQELIGKFKLILDTYTIDLPEFTTKYTASTSENKVAMNIEKVRQALNNKDYKYIYDKLYDVFKQNNFSSQDSLEQYLKANLFENNTFTYQNVEEKNGSYVSTINVTDETGTNTKKLTVIMKLQEGTDFVMSFSIE